MRPAALIGRAVSALGHDRAAYVLVSLMALGLDTVITLNLTWAGFAPALAATAGYVIGLALHWVLSSRFVFAGELSSDGPMRARQAALFFASGLGGLAVTVAAYSGAIALGAPPSLAKAGAVGVSFCIVYLIRRHLIFPQQS